jgi:hypothetical protein
MASHVLVHALRFRHLAHEAVEKIVAVLRARGGFGVVLDGEDGLALDGKAGVGAVEQRVARRFRGLGSSGC